MNRVKDVKWRKTKSTRKKKVSDEVKREKIKRYKEPPGSHRKKKEKDGERERGTMKEK